MNRSDWQLAEAIARELVNRETDVNEVHKAVTYARVQTTAHPDQVGERFFALLDTMTRDGRYLARSGRTLDYYRDLREVCGQHLRDYRTASGERGRQLVEILGWAARLMRYYTTAVGEAELVARHRAAPTPPQAEQRPSTADVPPRLPARQPTPPPPVPRVEIKRESVTLVAAVKGGKAQVRTAQGEEIMCTNLPAYPPSKAGDVCRADVTREGGKATKAVFKGWG
jgi:hypothetical protein